MRDEECVGFLQWALPKLQLRWAGFRRVRGQVCKRIARRMKDLDIASELAYRAHLERVAEEWCILDGLCRVSVSRFYRDKSLFSYLQEQVLPALARQVIARNDCRLRVWSVGCGSGEEPFSLALAWRLGLPPPFADLPIDILATDADETLLRRAREASYPYSAIKDLPAPWRDTAFTRYGHQYCLNKSYQLGVRFARQDVRLVAPNEQFDLVLCRNLVFTYFVEELQCDILSRLTASIRGGGALVIGIHETLPTCAGGLTLWSDRQRIYRKQ